MKEDTLVIHEIYASIQGESTFAGLPCTFVRTTGCNLRCTWCDTPQAFYGGTRMARTDVLELTRLVRARIGFLYKVLPTAIFAAAMRPSITRRDLETRIDHLLEELAAKRANLGVTSGQQAVDEAAEPLETRGIVVLERGRFRVRDRSVLRYYARTIEHLLATPGRTH